MSEFKVKSNTPIVINREDVLTLISQEEVLQLANIMQKIEDERFKLGKKIRQAYYVVDHDEPYAQEVFEVIKEGELQKENALFDKDPRFCKVCGCSQDFACPGGCHWLTDDLCSNCAYSIYTCEAIIMEDGESYEIVDGTEKCIAEEITSQEIAEGYIVGYAEALKIRFDTENIALNPGDIIINFTIVQREESVKEFNYLKGN